MKISSIPTTPDLYEEDEREENDVQNDILNDRNTKVRLKVSISETPKTVQCSSRTEDVTETEIREQDENEDKHEVLCEEEDEKKDAEETKTNITEEDKEEESEETVSIQEDISAGRTTEDDDEGNTYTIDEK
jgi:ribosomal protein L18